VGEKRLHWIGWREMIWRKDFKKIPPHKIWNNTRTNRRKVDEISLLSYHPTKNQGIQHPSIVMLTVRTPPAKSFPIKSVSTELIQFCNNRDVVDKKLWIIFLERTIGSLNEESIADIFAWKIVVNPRLFVTCTSWILNLTAWKVWEDWLALNVTLVGEV
jgi:hypothetical protein